MKTGPAPGQTDNPRQSALSFRTQSEITTVFCPRRPSGRLAGAAHRAWVRLEVVGGGAQHSAARNEKQAVSFR